MCLWDFILGRGKFLSKICSPKFSNFSSSIFQSLFLCWLWRILGAAWICIVFGEVNMRNSFSNFRVQNSQHQLFSLTLQGLREWVLKNIVSRHEWLSEPQGWSITCNIALCATLHYMQRCITCHIAVCATLH